MKISAIQNVLKLLYIFTWKNGKVRVDLSEIPKPILLQLNKGEIESANLVEWLAINQLSLLEHFLKANKRLGYLKIAQTAFQQLKKQTVLTTTECIGKSLYSQSIQQKDEELLTLLLQHTSDAVRCWACYFISSNSKLNLSQKVKAIHALANDSHFGVREIAWMAIRPAIATDLNAGLTLLEKWSTDKAETSAVLPASVRALVVFGVSILMR